MRLRRKHRPPPLMTPVREMEPLEVAVTLQMANGTPIVVMEDEATAAEYDFVEEWIRAIPRFPLH